MYGNHGTDIWVFFEEKKNIARNKLGVRKNNVVSNCCLDSKLTRFIIYSSSIYIKNIYKIKKNYHTTSWPKLNEVWPT